MLREGLKKHYIGMNQEFRFRGEEPGRLENFSDAVFALAITLLLISTSPPSSFAQIKRFLYDLLPFAICMTLLIVIWSEHNVFFLRYGLRNGRVIFLNTIFLMIVLFYVYPLKFLTRLIEIPLASLFGNEEIFRELTGTISAADVGDALHPPPAASLDLRIRTLFSVDLHACPSSLPSFRGWLHQHMP
nr:TMEM175 family protein [Cyclobacteriaceae bacterium]